MIRITFMKGPNAAKVNTAIGDGCVACVVVREEKNEAGGGFCSQSDSKKNWRVVVCVVVCMVVVVVGIVVVADANLPKKADPTRVDGRRVCRCCC